VQPKDAAGAFFSSDTFGHFAPMVLTTADNNRTGVAALASRMTKPAVIVAPRSNTTRLEDFEIQRKLGKGSFGVVYAVTRRRDPMEKKKTYVMKQISMGPSRADQEDAINECRVLAKLNHAHVVRYHESFVASGNRLCIVMEYAPKGTVHSLVQGAKPKTLAEDVVWKLTLQSALGLHHIHSLKILHRDIKAENIFLDKDGNAKIGDLGVAKVMTRTVDFAKTLVGTPYYLSPELCENKPYNHKSDVWSLGCVVYEMMTGSHPFNAQNQGALFIKILKGKYAPVRTPAYSHDLKELMDRCLTVNQTRRPDTVSILQSRAAHAKARTLGLELPGDVPAPGPGLGSENNQPDDLEVAKRAAAQQRRAATAVGSSRVRDVKPPQAHGDASADNRPGQVGSSRRYGPTSPADLTVSEWRGTAAPGVWRTRLRAWLINRTRVDRAPRSPGEEPSRRGARRSSRVSRLLRRGAASRGPPRLNPSFVGSEPTARGSRRRRRAPRRTGPPPRMPRGARRMRRRVDGRKRATRCAPRVNEDARLRRRNE
jgi:NIMA (never in mitosis gene a)-related kinase